MDLDVWYAFEFSYADVDCVAYGSYMISLLLLIPICTVLRYTIGQNLLSGCLCYLGIMLVMALATDDTALRDGLALIAPVRWRLTLCMATFVVHRFTTTLLRLLSSLEYPGISLGANEFLWLCGIRTAIGLILAVRVPGHELPSEPVELPVLPFV